MVMRNITILSIYILDSNSSGANTHFIKNLHIVCNNIFANAYSVKLNAINNIKALALFLFPKIANLRNQHEVKCNAHVFAWALLLLAG